jgi:hypothetical protein
MSFLLISGTLIFNVNRSQMLALVATALHYPMTAPLLALSYVPRAQRSAASPLDLPNPDLESTPPRPWVLRHDTHAFGRLW